MYHTAPLWGFQQPLRPMTSIIAESAEHHFLNFLEKIARDIGGWRGLHFSFSDRISHAEMTGDTSQIKARLFRIRKEAEAIAQNLGKGTTIAGAALYQFTDCDVVLLARPQGEPDRAALNELYLSCAATAGEKLSASHDLAKEIYNYQKMADQRFLGAQRIKAYESMADANRVQSIPLRRERHDEAVVMIVEDDRFTSSFAASVLNKEYELVVAKTGEQAIYDYIEFAPDVVLLDIHLPGLSGHDVLRALRVIDKDASVVMLSVDTAAESVKKASQDGAAGFLKKPVSKDRMLATVEKSPHVKNKKLAGQGRGRR